MAERSPVWAAFARMRRGFRRVFAAGLAVGLAAVVTLGPMSAWRPEHPGGGGTVSDISSLPVARLSNAKIIDKEQVIEVVGLEGDLTAEALVRVLSGGCSRDGDKVFCSGVVPATATPGAAHSGEPSDVRELFDAMEEGRARNGHRPANDGRGRE